MPNPTKEKSTTLTSIIRATEFEERHRISFWDARGIVAVYKDKCERILTEDLNSGQIIEGAIIENLFKVMNR